MSYFNTDKYVKFIKGTQNAFNNLIKNGGVDENTLYFIKDNDELKLYLGTTLISSTEPKDEVLSLNGLSDVELGEVIGSNSVLSYNSEKNQWVETSLTDLANLLNILTEEDVQGIVNPIVTKAVGDLIGEAPEAFDTLKEIADWINGDETGTVALVTRVGNLETLTQENKNKIEENGESINSLNTSVGNLNAAVEALQDIFKDSEGGTIDLKNYLTIASFNTTVGSLSNLKTEKKDSLVEAINELNDRLAWGEISE